jgi:tRNA(fMet)-specific endonuclease VapC
MKYLLDTNAWIEVLNKPTGLVAIKLARCVPVDVALCSVVLAELLVGVYKSSQPAANLLLVQQLVQQFICLPFDEVSADHYARLRSHLESLGQPIGPYDMQIAGIALEYGLIVVTHNTAEFSRVPGLVLEDWQV